MKWGVHAQVPKAEKVQAGDCYTVDATHLMLKILPRTINAQARDRSDVLGAALVDGKGVGYYAYVFYDGVRRVAEERGLGHYPLARQTAVYDHASRPGRKQ